MPAVAADAPRRVVSFNVCADQLVIALADPGQIVALSPYARDPAISVVAEKARALSAARLAGGSHGAAQARPRAGRLRGTAR